jgi:glycosyltransferase involved in cell wall biosynthesis
VGKKNEKRNDRLKICLLTYRGNPTCGGQGVYINYLSRALRDLGHEVDVLSGPPYPVLADGVRLHKLPGLDLYNPDHLFEVKNIRDLLYPLNQIEYVSMCAGGFPEPFTFGWRVYRYLRKSRHDYDVIHDNQCLAYGLLGLPSLGFPTLATIHHPITVDRDVELKASPGLLKKIKVLRWYAFIRMQKRVTRRLTRIITVSECSKRDIGLDFRVATDKFRVVPNGINTDYFYPLPHIRRQPNHLLTTNSADTPLKGLRYLLEAVKAIRKKRPIHLTVIGEPKKDGVVERLVKDWKLSDNVRFTGRIGYEEFAGYYAQSTMAVIPSLYEGFGMPAGEAMACGTPVISTTGGALPEVVGDAGMLVPPGDSKALVGAIEDLLDHPAKGEEMGKAGLRRVMNSLTWEHAAKKTVEVYRETIDADRRFQ